MFNDSYTSASPYGEFSSSQFEELKKALLAPSSTDDFYNTSGGAITMQSLEGTLIDLTLNANDFTFWKDIPKNKAFSTIEEFDQQIGQGISDGGFVGQMDNPEPKDPDIRKQIAYVKFMSEMWTCGDVSQATKTISDPRSIQQRAAMIRLLRNLNRALFTGNSTWIPKSFDGIAKATEDSSSYQVRDMRGGNLSMNTFNIAGQIITEGNGNAGGCNVYVSPAGIQNLAKIIETGAASTGDRKIVEMGNSGITIGGQITNIMTNYGAMKPRMDKVLGMEYENKSVPQYYDKDSDTWVEGATSDSAPGMPSIALTNNATTTDSLFSASGVRPSGVKYNYRVCARNAYGRSVACAAVESTSVVAAGGSVTIAITPASGDSGSTLPTCFEIYSEQVSGSGVYRYLTTVAANTSPLTAVSYTDKNDYIPGTARMFIVDPTGAGPERVIAFSQLLPIYNKDLAPNGNYSWGLINMFGTPKFYKPQTLIEIRNIGVEQTNPNLFNTI